MSEAKDMHGRRPGAVRKAWTVLCVAATVLLAPSAVVASALEQANAAPPRSASASAVVQTGASGAGGAGARPRTAAHP